MFLYDNDKTRTESTYLCRTICYGILKLMYPRAEIRQNGTSFENSVWLFKRFLTESILKQINSI